MNDTIALADRERSAAEELAEKQKRLADAWQERERAQAAREQGRTEGRKESLSEGRAQGNNKGLDEAFEHARTEAMRRLDDYLVRNGLSYPEKNPTRTTTPKKRTILNKIVDARTAARSDARTSNRQKTSSTATTAGSYSKAFGPSRALVGSLEAEIGYPSPRDLGCGGGEELGGQGGVNGSVHNHFSIF